jgi:HEAT repeat protein
MANSKRKPVKRDGFRLNEPVARISGGERRTSILAKGAQFAQIRRRQQLNQILLVHDPDSSRKPIGLRDMAIVRQIAMEGPAANQVPVLRRNAILALAESTSHENLDLLAELALAGEDFYVRSNALLALGRTGLKVVVPLLRDGLKAEESHERQAAEVGLAALGRKTGHGVLRAVFENERDEKIREVLSRILIRLDEQRGVKERNQETSSRPKARP